MKNDVTNKKKRHMTNKKWHVTNKTCTPQTKQIYINHSMLQNHQPYPANTHQTVT